VLSLPDLGHPANCQHCNHLRGLTRKRIALEYPREVAVQTWCRMCGVPVLMQVTLDYDYALRNFYVLDDRPMTHKTIHAERGGWGVHWRLDEVLATVFPSKHLEVCWPRPAWYEHNMGEDHAISVVNPKDLQSVERMVDMELMRLRDMINTASRSREELERMAEPVLDTTEFSQRYELIGVRAPFAVVRIKATGEIGSMLFQNHPRYYFSYSADRVI
jgi:hypothetical protein